MRQIDTESELTPACTLGFVDRLNELMSRAGLQKNSFVAFVVEATGLSNSGARRIFNDKRPPKRKDTFLRLTDPLASLVSARSGVAIAVEDIIDYLLTAKPIPALATQDDFDITPYLNINPVLTSQIIIKIEAVAKAKLLDTSRDLTSEQMRLIRFRIISYCYKNKTDYESAKVVNMIESLFELAKQHLL